MKRLSKIIWPLVILWALVALLCWQSSAMAVESLFMVNTQMSVGTTKTPGTFKTSFNYSASGSAEGTNFEVQQQTKSFGTGSFPSVLIYKSASGALVSQEAFTGTGFLNSSTKTGANTLVTSVKDDEPDRVYGVLQQDAVGASVRSTGGIQYQVDTATSGGMVMSQQAAFVGISIDLKGGAVRWTTEGYGPKPGTTGESSSAITFNFSDHVQAGGATLNGSVFPLQYQYGISFNPSGSILPQQP
jgi:hypothetical protein